MFWLNKFSKRPLVNIAIIFCIGVISANMLKPNIALVYFLSFLSVAVCLLSLRNEVVFNPFLEIPGFQPGTLPYRRASARFVRRDERGFFRGGREPWPSGRGGSTIFLFFAIFFLGASLLSNSRYLPKCHISNFVSYSDDSLYTVKGYIVSRPQSGNNKVSFVFRVEEMYREDIKYNSCGDILVHSSADDILRYAQELILRGNLYRPFRGGLQGRRGYREYLAGEGIYLIMNIKPGGIIADTAKSKGSILNRFCFLIAQKTENILSRYLSSTSTAIVEAMVLGQKGNISHLIYNSMMCTGTVHILVVSGFNVGIVVFIIILFLKLIRVPKVPRFCLTAILLVVYCLISGASNPVVRATVMAIIFMFAYFVRRETDIFNSCAIAAIFILAIRPAQLFDIGFQLSFASVISIAYFYPKLKSLCRLDKLKNLCFRFLADGLLVSLSAWLGTMGIIFYYFRIFSPITVLANIFIVPLATLITLSGFSLILAGLAAPFLARIFANACELLIAILVSVNFLLMKVPGAYFKI